MKNISILCILLSTLMSSCTADYFNPVVDITPRVLAPKLVVIANMQSDYDTLIVYVSKSRGSLDNSTYNYNPDSVRQRLDTVAGVQVQLFKNGTLFANLNSIGGGNFAVVGKRLPADGATYNLKVSAPGFPSVEATQIMPSIVKLDTAQFIPNGVVDLEGRRNAEYVMNFRDPVGTNYYMGYVINDQQTSPDTIRTINLVDLGFLVSDNVLIDNTFDGKSYRWSLTNGRGGGPGSPNRGGPGGPRNQIAQGIMSFYLLNISKEMYQYQKSYTLYKDARDNPFAQPVVLYTNINNGFGLFSLQAASKITIKL
jgi:Domain of unknown function (DUF4249)